MTTSNVITFQNLYKLNSVFDSVLKRSLSIQWMQVKLFLSLSIGAADCMQFLQETTWTDVKFLNNSVFRKPNPNEFLVFPYTATWYLTTANCCWCRVTRHPMAMTNAMNVTVRINDSTITTTSDDDSGVVMSFLSWQLADLFAARFAVNTSKDCSRFCSNYSVFC